MVYKNIFRIVVVFLLIFNLFIAANWFIEKSSSKAYAQDSKSEDIGRYQLQYVPTHDGSDPRYLLLDTATGVFWEAKGFIENVDNFCIYSASDLKIAKIGNHTVGMHKHK